MRLSPESCQTWRCVALYAAVIAAIFILTSLCSEADGHWEWTPAAEHHAAAVRVTTFLATGEQYHTSGTYCRWGELVGVLTCAHGLRSADVAVRFQDGETRSGAVHRDRHGHDVGWVAVEHPGVVPLAVSPSAPSRGATVEVLTHGGPLRSLRHFRAEVGRGDENRQWYDALVIHGDSGGAILAETGIVGVQAYGGEVAGAFEHAGRRHQVFRGAGAAPYAALTAFLDRVAAAERQTQGCAQPGFGIGAGIGVGPIYPPRAPPAERRPPVYVPPPRDTPAGCDCRACECGDIRGELDSLRQDVAALELREGPAGPAGEQGPVGAPGPAGPPGEPAPPREVRVIFQDSRSGETILGPVVVPPDKSTVRVPLERFVVE